MMKGIEKITKAVSRNPSTSSTTNLLDNLEEVTPEEIEQREQQQKAQDEREREEVRKKNEALAKGQNPFAISTEQESDDDEEELLVQDKSDEESNSSEDDSEQMQNNNNYQNDEQSDGELEQSDDDDNEQQVVVIKTREELLEHAQQIAQQNKNQLNKFKNMFGSKGRDQTSRPNMLPQPPTMQYRYNSIPIGTSEDLKKQIEKQAKEQQKKEANNVKSYKPGLFGFRKNKGPEFEAVQIPTYVAADSTTSGLATSPTTQSSLLVSTATSTNSQKPTRINSGSTYQSLSSDEAISSSMVDLEENSFELVEKQDYTKDEEKLYNHVLEVSRLEAEIKQEKKQLRKKYFKFEIDLDRTREILENNNNNNNYSEFGEYQSSEDFLKRLEALNSKKAELEKKKEEIKKLLTAIKIEQDIDNGEEPKNTISQFFSNVFESRPKRSFKDTEQASLFVAYKLEENFEEVEKVKLEEKTDIKSENYSLISRNRQIEEQIKGYETEESKNLTEIRKLQKEYQINLEKITENKIYSLILSKRQKEKKIKQHENKESENSTEIEKLQKEYQTNLEKINQLRQSLYQSWQPIVLQKKLEELREEKREVKFKIQTFSNDLFTQKNARLSLQKDVLNFDLSRNKILLKEFKAKLKSLQLKLEFIELENQNKALTEQNENVLEHSQQQAKDVEQAKLDLQNAQKEFFSNQQKSQELAATLTGLVNKEEDEIFKEFGKSADELEKDLSIQISTLRSNQQQLKTKISSLQLVLTDNDKLLQEINQTNQKIKNNDQRQKAIIKELYENIKQEKEELEKQLHSLEEDSALNVTANVDIFNRIQYALDLKIKELLELNHLADLDLEELRKATNALKSNVEELRNTVAQQEQQRELLEGILQNKIVLEPQVIDQLQFLTESELQHEVQKENIHQLTNQISDKEHELTQLRMQVEAQADLWQQINVINQKLIRLKLINAIKDKLALLDEQSSKTDQVSEQILNFSRKLALSRKKLQQELEKPLNIRQESQIKSFEADIEEKQKRIQQLQDSVDPRVIEKQKTFLNSKLSLLNESEITEPQNQLKNTLKELKQQIVDPGVWQKIHQVTQEVDHLKTLLNYTRDTLYKVEKELTYKKQLSIFIQILQKIIEKINLVKSCIVPTNNQVTSQVSLTNLQLDDDVSEDDASSDTSNETEEQQEEKDDTSPILNVINTKVGIEEGTQDTIEAFNTGLVDVSVNSVAQKKPEKKSSEGKFVRIIPDEIFEAKEEQQKIQQKKIEQQVKKAIQPKAEWQKKIEHHNSKFDAFFTSVFRAVDRALGLDQKRVDDASDLLVEDNDDQPFTPVEMLVTTAVTPDPKAEKLLKDFLPMQANSKPTFVALDEQQSEQSEIQTPTTVSANKPQVENVVKFKPSTTTFDDDLLVSNEEFDLPAQIQAIQSNILTLLQPYLTNSNNGAAEKYIVDRTKQTLWAIAQHFGRLENENNAIPYLHLLMQDIIADEEGKELQKQIVTLLMPLKITDSTEEKEIEELYNALKDFIYRQIALKAVSDSALLHYLTREKCILENPLALSPKTSKTSISSVADMDALLPLDTKSKSTNSSKFGSGLVAFLSKISITTKQKNGQPNSQATVHANNKQNNQASLIEAERDKFINSAEPATVTTLVTMNKSST